MWVLPTSPIFYLVRPDYFKCVLFKEFFKKITVSEFDREEKPIVLSSKKSVAEPQQNSSSSLYYVYTRKGRKRCWPVDGPSLFAGFDLWTSSGKSGLLWGFGCWSYWPMKLSPNGIPVRDAARLFKWVGYLPMTRLSGMCWSDSVEVILWQKVSLAEWRM